MELVVTEIEDHILLFEQHEHARVCGEFAEAWKEEYFVGEENKASVIYAIYEHDNGWIELDRYPLLNRKTLVPYSFINYPLGEKLQAYTNGINRVEQQDNYAALICSLHYTSFFEGYTNGRGEDFLTQERERQEKFRQQLTINNESLLFHYRLLQFCDNLSLYLCMNEPGVDKQNEFVWFRRGFAQKFPYNNQRKIIAHWLDKETVSLTDFPFKNEITVTLNYKKVKKSNVLNLQQEYEQKPLEQRVVTIVKG